MALLWIFMYEFLFGCMLLFFMECGFVFNEFCSFYRGFICGRFLGGYVFFVFRIYVVFLDVFWVFLGYRFFV